MRKKILANGKINIGLNVLGKLPNGYHLLDMTMVPISLADTLDVEFFQEEGELTITSNIEGIPLGPENIVYKIYNGFYQKTGLKKRKINLFLEKTVPSEAGLGGGSSDGAQFLKVLNEFHGAPLNENQMMDLGKSIGADIPFFIRNESSRVQGIGEIVEKIENNLDCDLILIKPQFGVSTKVAYENVSKVEHMKMANMDMILQGLRENSLEMVKRGIENNLESALLIDNEDIIGFRKLLDGIGGLEFFMSGSGSAYFTFVEKNRGEFYLNKLRKEIKNCKIYLCSFL